MLDRKKALVEATFTFETNNFAIGNGTPRLPDVVGVDSFVMLPTTGRTRDYIPVF